MSRQFSVTFCDDVRQEVGGKFSLIGAYSDELVAQGPLPLVLPKLCAFARIVTTLDQPLGSAVFRAYLGDEVLSETAIPAERLRRVIEMPGTARLGRFSVQCILTISPLVIQEQSEMRVDVETEEGVTVIGKLLLRVASGGNSDPAGRRSCEGRPAR